MYKNKIFNYEQDFCSPCFKANEGQKRVKIRMERWGGGSGDAKAVEQWNNDEHDQRLA